MFLFSHDWGGGLELRLVVWPFGMLLLKEKRNECMLPFRQAQDSLELTATDWWEGKKQPLPNRRNQSTYKFLTNHAIFEEEHVWCDAIFIVVQGCCDACWVHGATRVKLSSDKSQSENKGQEVLAHWNKRISQHTFL